MKYIIVEAGNHEWLERWVQAKIDEGYLPLGGVATVIKHTYSNRAEHDIKYYQAMIRESRDENST